MIKKILLDLYNHKTLDRSTAYEVIEQMGKGTYSDAEIASFITVFLMRSITLDELSGFRDALIDLATKVNLNGYDTIDVVGTGGDGKNTFNISTVSCFVIAGSGEMVSKHGNYGATSLSGSSNVMEYFGYKFSNSNEKLLKELEQTNICFMHAPLFHPALKHVAGVRKSLGVRTFFNLMGPLVNPARPKYKMVGVYNLEVGRFYNYLLQLEQNPYAVVHSLDGYDEISLTADTKIFTRGGEKIFKPEELGKRMASAIDLYGGTTQDEAAGLFIKILKGEGSWAQNAVVMANAATAINIMHPELEYETCFQKSIDSLESGKAFDGFRKLMDMQ